jgi:hypothetical protein
MSYQREPNEPLQTKDFVVWVETMSRPLLIVMAFGVVAGILLGAFGLLLVLEGSAIANIHVSLFGVDINTTSVGVACVVVGAVVVDRTIGRVVRALGELLKEARGRRSP